MWNIGELTTHLEVFIPRLKDSRLYSLARAKKHSKCAYLIITPASRHHGTHESIWSSRKKNLSLIFHTFQRDTSPGKWTFQKWLNGCLINIMFKLKWHDRSFFTVISFKSFQAPVLKTSSGNYRNLFDWPCNVWLLLKPLKVTLTPHCACNIWLLFEYVNTIKQNRGF